jgi:hypothetical protein
LNFAVRLEPATASPPAVEYCWDTDTDILAARLGATQEQPEGVSGSVELEGTDGSWLIFDVRRGRISGIEIAVWPDVHKNAALAPPGAQQDALVLVPLAATGSGQGSLEIEAPIRAEADDAERVIYFRIGQKREVRAVRLARDLLLELDPQSRIAGLWLLNVPPFPAS